MKKFSFIIVQLTYMITVPLIVFAHDIKDNKLEIANLLFNDTSTKAIVDTSHLSEFEHINCVVYNNKKPVHTAYGTVLGKYTDVILKNQIIDGESKTLNCYISIK